MRKLLLVVAAIALLGGVAYSVSDFGHMRDPVVFYAGHWHDDEGTHGAPAHSGGTNSQGCHNASVPYHCH